MALVSFRLRRTDSDGSYVREEDRLDSAIRGDSYIVPSSADGLSSFSASVMNVVKKTIIDSSRPGGQYDLYEYDTLLEWTLTEDLVLIPVNTSPIELHVTVNQYGEPLTVEDGTSVFSCDSTSFVESHRHITTLYKPGTWLYYGLFIRYVNESSEWFERVATVPVQLPRYYQSLEDLWQRIPEHYRASDYSEGRGHLRKYLSLFGWELDRMRTLIDSLITVNDPITSPTSTLDAIAKQLGLPITSLDVGTARLRNVLLNVFNLRQRKGTADGISAFISSLSGSRTRYDADTSTFYVYSQRVNLLSDPLFRQQDVSFYLGTPSVINRTPFTLRSEGGGSALRNPDDNDDAIRNYNSNPLSIGELAEYTTTLTTDSAASVGWGVYTYGSAYSGDNGASVPVVNAVVYEGEDASIDNFAAVFGNTGDGISIEIPDEALGPQVVIVYGRKPFYYRNDVTYYSSFNCNLSGASFVNFRLITNNTVSTVIEIDPPDSVGEALFYDSWNTESAANQNIFLYGNTAFYNASSPGLATLGRFSIQHPETPDFDNVEQAVVPALVFFANPGDTIIISKWLVEPNSVGGYFDGNSIYGGFIQQANEPLIVGTADYRWGSDGGSNNEDFSYYTLDYARITNVVERVVENDLIPVNMIGQYTIEWNTIPGE